jgi:Xaa-Pro aminopeptidase
MSTIDGKASHGSGITVPVAFFAEHRGRLLKALGRDAAILFAPPHRLRNADTEYRYRQSSDVYYLSGWEDPEAALLFRPGADKPFVMFVQPKDPEREVWTGVRPGPEGAVATWGADEAFPFAELDRKLPELLLGYRTIHYRFGEHSENDEAVSRAIQAARRLARKTRQDVPDTIVDPSKVLHELRLVKTPDELALLRHSAAISKKAHLAAMGMTRPGVHEYELEARIDSIFRSEGGNGAGYTTIVGGGRNATVLHYVRNSDPLRDGDLVCVDAGCEYQYYTTDVTRTWPVSGRFTDAQKALYQLVLDAELAAIESIKPGEPYKIVHDTATRVLVEGMIRLGLLQGEPQKALDSESYKRFYMHSTGHWLGLDVHDAGVYNRDGDSRAMDLGMVTTVEPGIYVSANDEQAPAQFRGLGIRIEDDVLVTESGYEVLTQEIPKEIADVEAAVGRG